MARKVSCDEGHEFSRTRADGARRCAECERERDRQRTNLIRLAHQALGLSQREYKAQFGGSARAALAVARERGAL
jgi:hypothetical protein